MTITYDPNAPSGRQYSATLPDGRKLTGVSARIIEALARDAGLSVRQAESAVAKARATAAA
jgi:hypothetical protein